MATERERVPWEYLAAGLAIRLVVLARWGDGLAHPDQTYQSLEPAHYLAFGYGILTWEWFEGVRTWLVPLFYALPIRAAALVGLDGPAVPMVVAQLISVGFSLLVVDSTWRLTRAVSSRPAAHVAATLAAALPVLLFYAPRPLGDCPAAALLLAAYACYAESWDHERPQRATFIAGLLVGAAYVFRFTTPMFFVAPGVLLLVQRRWRAAAALAAGFFAVFVLAGLTDWPTWGRPFHSIYHYFRFNVVEGGSRRFGVEAPEWYLGVLYHDLGPLAFVTLVAMVLGGQRTRGVGAGLLAGLVLAAGMEHKEARFLLPFWTALPSLLALGAFRLAGEDARRPLRVAGALAALCVASHAWEYARRDMAPQAALVHALRYVGGRPDAHGVYVAAPTEFVGGYTALHRPIPLVATYRDPNDPALRALFENPLIDYLVVDAGIEAELRKRLSGLTVARRFGQLTVLRKPPGPD